MRLLVLACFVGLVASAPAEAAADEAGPAAATRIAEGAGFPVDLAFGPGGALYFAELSTGDVRRVLPGGGFSDVVAHVDASAGGNGGFTGLAADPERPETFYLVYSFEKASAPTGKVNRVSRIDGGTETVIVDDLPWYTDHVGGRIILGPDGLLYVTTGDNAPADRRVGDARDKRSQEPDRLEGKILRYDVNGTPAQDNMEGAHPAVYALGFRNPFGMDFTSDGRLVVSENGADEEIDIIARGANYGWPLCAGPCGRADITDPVAYWDVSGAGFGPTGIAILGGTVYVGDFNHGQVRTADLETGATGSYWKAPTAGILDVERGPDGCLYVSTMEEIHQLRPAGVAACTEYASAVPATAPVEPVARIRTPTLGAGVLVALFALLALGFTRP